MRIKLVRNVAVSPLWRSGNCTFPPLSTSILTAYLQNKCHDIVQDDLHIKWYRILTEHETEKLEILTQNRMKLWDYLQYGNDKDWDWYGDTVSALTQFENFNIILISIHSSDHMCSMAALALARYLKNKFNVTIVIGGEYYAYPPIRYVIDGVLKTRAIDYYISGFGESPLDMLLNYLDGNKKNMDLKLIPGLCYLENNETKTNQYELFHETVVPLFDGLPLELYQWQAKTELLKNKFITENDRLMLPFQTSTGCPFNCAFCESSSMNKVSIMPPQIVAKSLEYFKHQYHCHTFFFVDNSLNARPGYVEELCDEIIKRRLNIQWMDSGCVKGMGKDTLLKMREAGCIRIVWGLESGSKRILKFINKPTSLENASKVFHLANEAGIWNGVEILVGMPTETDHEFAETLDFLNDHKDVLDEIWANPYYLNAVSKMYLEPDRYGIQNIRRVNMGLTKEKGMNRASVAEFDEKSGLKWHDKEKQIAQRLFSVNQLKFSLSLDPGFDLYDYAQHLLSWCYRNFNSKTEIRKEYREFILKLKNN